MASSSATRSPLIGMRNSCTWTVPTWVSFGIAVCVCATALFYRPGEALDRSFMAMGCVFCLSAVCEFSKAVRDAQQTAASLRALETMVSTAASGVSSFDQAPDGLKFRGDQPSASFHASPNESRLADRIDTVTVDSVLDWLTHGGLPSPPQSLAR